MYLKDGTLLQGGRYRIDSFIAQGGFGVTYKGEQVSLGRKVAVKEFFMKELCERDPDSSMVSVPSLGSREMVERFRVKFLKEARNLASIKCKGIVSVIDVFEENGTAYYVMDYLEGGSLADMLKGGALPEAKALRYISQVAEALSYMHNKNMMHLDVKPSNILLDNEDNAVLIDFGLSKQYDDVGNQTSTTPVGLSHGYAPMEQYRRGGVSSFSPATDIYSLGATLYKLLTGKTPPEASDLLNNGLPPMPATVSSATQNAVVAAMQPQIGLRPKNIAEFISMLSADEPEEKLSPAVRSKSSYDVENEETRPFVSSAASVPGDRTIVEEETTPVVKKHQTSPDQTAPVAAKQKPGNSRLPLVNAFFITEASFNLIQVLLYLLEIYEASNILWMIRLPVSLIFSIVMLCYAKGVKANWGASLLLFIMIVRVAMNLTVYDSNLYFFRFEMVEDYALFNIIYLSVFYLIYLSGCALLLSGSGASGKLVQAVVGIYLLSALFEIGQKMYLLDANYELADVFLALCEYVYILGSIYMIVFCSMTFSDKLKQNRRSGSSVWVLIRIFTIVFFVSCALPFIGGIDEWYLDFDINLFEMYCMIDNFTFVTNMFLLTFLLLVGNFIQSLVFPRKWINGLSSGLLIVLMFFVILAGGIADTFEFGFFLAAFAALGLFILTFIPAKK